MAQRRFRLKKIPEKTHLGTLRKFKKFYNLNDPILKRIITEGPQTDRSVPKDRREYEAAVYSDFNKYFTPVNMQELRKEAKGPLVDLYRDLRNFRRTGTLKTTEQEQAVREGIEGVSNQPAYRERQVGEQQGTRPTTQNVGAQQPSDLLSQQLSNIISQIPARTTSKKSRKKGKNQPPTRREQGVEAAKQVGQELVDLGAQAYQQGAPEIPRFGQDQAQSPMLGAYDELINRIRPQRTTAQRAAAAAAPYAGSGGAALGQALGTALGGPGLGTAIGGGLGALGGLGLGAGLNRLSAPKPELAALGRLIGGTRAGWLRGGDRGLAGLISGEDPRSWLRTGFGLLRRRPTGGRLRQRLGGGLRGVGDWLSQPGRAQQIRTGLQAAEAAYNFGEESGLNSLIGRGVRGLGQRLGIFPETRNQRQVIQGDVPQQGLAAQAINPALAFAVPALQRQASQAMGRPIAAQQVAQGLDDTALAAVAPQLARQEIEQSRIRSKRQALNLRKQGIEVDAATQEALNRLRGQQQQERFGRAVRQQDLRAREATERAKMQAVRNQLSKMEALSGQQVRMQMPIERVPQQPGVPEALMATAGQLQQATTPYVQSRISQALNQPIIVNPTVTQPSALSSSNYDLTIT